METTKITPNEIFEKNQVLTVEKVKSLIGKKLAVTNAEYRYNRPSVRVFTLLGIQTAFESAAKIPCENYESLQDMWLKENNQAAIKRAKGRLVLKYEGENPWATCDNSNACLPKGTFFGSDADREIYYIEL